MGTERRATKRWDVGVRVIFEDLGQQQKQAIASDISNKGVKLFSPKDVNIGTEADIAINLEHLGYIFAKVQACWRDARPNGTYAGFKFIQIKESERNKIFEYVTHYHRQQVRDAWFAPSSNKETLE